MHISINTIQYMHLQRAPHILSCQSQITF